MSADPRRRLEEAGQRPAPDPDPAFADALEARLLTMAASLPPVPPPPVRRPGPGARWWPVAAGAALVALALVLAITPGRPAPDSARELVAPVNVEVALADGTVLEDPDGLVLPEGAVVRVGPGGSARIGDLALGPGDVATLSGGRLRVAHGEAVVQVPGGATPTSTATHGATNGPTGSPTSPASMARPTPAPTLAPTGDPASGSPAPARTEVPPSVKPTPTATPAILPPRLRARAIGESRVAVTWTATWRAASYLLLITGSRQGPAPDPVYPGSRILGEFARPPETPLRFRVPDGVVEVRLMVVALRRDGTELRRSLVVTVAVDTAVDGAVDGGLDGAAATPSP